MEQNFCQDLNIVLRATFYAHLDHADLHNFTPNVLKKTIKLNQRQQCKAWDSKPEPSDLLIEEIPHLELSDIELSVCIG